MAAALALVREHKPIAQVAKETGISYDALRARVIKEGIPRRGPGGALPKKSLQSKDEYRARRKAIEEAFALGYRAKEVVELLNEDPQYVFAVKTRMNREAGETREGVWSTETMNEALAAIREGLPVDEVAVAWGIPARTLRNYANDQEHGMLWVPKRTGRKK